MARLSRSPLRQARPADRIADVVGDKHAAGPVDGDTGYQ
jgi:hypothetical protein